MGNGNDAAFACAAEGGHQKGLTKREYFAALAMQGLCARDDHEIGDYNTTGQHEKFNRRVVTDLGKQAVNIADAVLAALESGVSRQEKT
jgi:hypothetical protein